MRPAAARAARRLGSSISTPCPFIQSWRMSSRGTRVVFPDPGGAARTALRPSRSRSQSSGSTSWIGRSWIEGVEIKARVSATFQGGQQFRAGGFSTNRRSILTQSHEEIDQEYSLRLCGLV